MTIAVDLGGNATNKQNKQTHHVGFNQAYLYYLVGLDGKNTPDTLVFIGTLGLTPLQQSGMKV